MPILSGQTSFTGLSGVNPNLVFIDTNDTVAEVTTAGYLNHAVQEGMLSLKNGYMALVITQVNPAPHTPKVPIFFYVSITGTGPNLIYSLVPAVNAAGAIFLGDVQAGANGVAGGFLSYPAALNTGHLHLFATANAGNFTVDITNASQAAARTFTIPDPGVAAASFLLTQNAGTQTIATGNLAVTNGIMVLGSAGVASRLVVFPATALNGTFIFEALNAGGAFNTTVRNSVMGQSSVISIPDPGAATANFLLDAGAGNLVTDYQEMMPITDFGVAAAGGVFTLTRTAQGDWAQVHTAAADTSILGIDVTEQLRAAAGRGFELTSFDVMYSIATLALVANTATLATTVYANNVAVAVTNVAITGGTLATATQAQPYLSNVTVNAPAFTNPAAGTAVKQVIELTVDAAATSVYSFLGVNLRFTKSIK